MSNYDKALLKLFILWFFASGFVYLISECGIDESIVYGFFIMALSDLFAPIFGVRK